MSGREECGWVIGVGEVGRWERGGSEDSGEL